MPLCFSILSLPCREIWEWPHTCNSSVFASFMIELWGKRPVRGDTPPRHEPGTGRDQSRNTSLGG